jgi:hypothetical protein
MAEYFLNVSTPQQLNKQKSARELRQGGSDYRCCIPALAGLVSPQSIAPDGNKISLEDQRCAIAFSERAQGNAFRFCAIGKRPIGECAN